MKYFTTLLKNDSHSQTADGSIIKLDHHWLLSHAHGPASTLGTPLSLQMQYTPLLAMLNYVAAGSLRTAELPQSQLTLSYSAQNE